MNLSPDDDRMEALLRKAMEDRRQGARIVDLAERMFLAGHTAKHALDSAREFVQQAEAFTQDWEQEHAIANAVEVYSGEVAKRSQQAVQKSNISQRLKVCDDT